MEAQKLSLGLRPSYFEGEAGEDKEPDLAADDMDEEAFAAAVEMDSDEDVAEEGEAAKHVAGCHDCEKGVRVFRVNVC